MVQSTTLDRSSLACIDMKRPFQRMEVMRRACWHMFGPDGHNRRRGRLLQEPRFDCRHKFCRSGPCPRSYNGPINNIGPVIAGMHRYEKAMPANGSHAPCLLAYVSRMAIIAGVA